MPSTQIVRVTDFAPDVALLTIAAPDRQPNLLSSTVLAELEQQLEELQRREGLVGLIVRSGRPGVFVGGADLGELRRFGRDRHKFAEFCRSGKSVLRRLADCPFMTVAAIEGACLGGGAELALWCDRRVCATGSGTRIGFPEVRLGLLPGFGGTVRAPRIVGLERALYHVLSGEPLRAAAAVEQGWASAAVPSESLLDAAMALIRSDPAREDLGRERQRRLEPLPIHAGELAAIRQQALAQAEHGGGHPPAVLAALDLMLETASLVAEAALRRETDAAAALFESAACPALVNAFFLAERNRNDSGVDRSELTPAAIQRLGVVGAGVMGCSIAAASLHCGLPVVISDAASDALARCQQLVLAEAAWNDRRGAADPDRVAELAPLLRTASSEQDFAGCDLVIESIVETLEVKRRVLHRLEPQLRADAILASNTSTIPISQLAGALEHPARFCGIHFCNPVRHRKLVEVVRGKQTADLTVVTAMAYAKALGKMPIVVGDGPGFLVNRVLFPYLSASLELLSEGAAAEEIDSAAQAFGMSLGPLGVYDLIGIDTSFYAGRSLWDAFRDRIVPSPILPALFKAGRLGRKKGVGFYVYSEPSPPRIDSELARLVEPYVRSRKHFNPQQLTARLILPMLLEATRVIEEGIVRDPRDIDLAAIYGLGFPAAKGGLLFWADSLGIPAILDMLEPWAYLGPRAAAPALLVEMAKHGRSFYAAGH